jgi:PAS domain S-box-containing protein
MPDKPLSTILVVDDHEPARYVRSRILRQHGYKVIEAGTGAEALSLVIAAMPDLVILDVHLPDINGLEICQRIKVDPILKVIPVLHMSATNISAPEQVRGLEGGADGYLVEPVPPEVLVATVGALLRMHRAEKETREARRAMDVLIGNLPGAAYRCARPGGPLTFVSVRVRELTGYTAEELMAAPAGWWDLIPREDRAALEAAMKSNQPGEHSEFTYRIITKDGAERWVWDRATAVRFGPEGLELWEGFATDITERRQAQELIAREKHRLAELVSEKTAELERSYEQLRVSERLASLGTLSAGLGHDLGNLLLPLRVRLDNLKAMELGYTAQRELEGISEACEYLRRLSSGLRLLASDSSDGTNVHATEVHDWWQDAGSLYRSTLPSQISLVSTLPERECWVAVSKTALTQAIFNLVQNAGYAMREAAAGRVTVRVERASSNTWRLTIEDDGPGMSPEVLARCLEPFYTTKPRGLSTGLGLALVYGLVKDAGGTMQVRSSVGEGAAFEITLGEAKPPLLTDSAQKRRVLGVRVRDGQLQAIIAREAAQMHCEVKSLGLPDAADAPRVVDRLEDVGPAPRRVLYLGDDVAATQGVICIGARPRIHDLRIGLRQLLSQDDGHPQGAPP